MNPEDIDFDLMVEEAISISRQRMLWYETKCWREDWTWAQFFHYNGVKY